MDDGSNRCVGWRNAADTDTSSVLASILSDERDRFEALSEADRWEEAKMLYRIVVDDYNRR